MSRCLTTDQITALILDEVSPDERTSSETHLGSCNSCRAVHEVMARVNGQAGISADPGREGESHLRKEVNDTLARFAELSVPWGTVFAASTKRGLTRIEFQTTADGMAAMLANDGLIPDLSTEGLEEVKKELEEYFEGRRRRFGMPLDLRVHNSFRRRVLEETSRIPAGSYSTYKRIAEEVGSPRAHRAVGNAVGANPIPIVIPCHRVLATGGGLGGYGGGLEIKRYLLELEGVSVGRATRAASR
jgi:methylated-DNA-[protein]-cysteine S-methyltransferase